MKRTITVSLLSLCATLSLSAQTTDNFRFKEFSTTDIETGHSALYTQPKVQRSNPELLLTSITTTNQISDTYFIYDENNRYIAQDGKQNGERKSTDSIYYDANGRISHIDLYISFTGGEPALDTRFKYTYNENNNLATRDVYMLAFDPETPMAHTEYTYDEDGKLSYWIVFSLGAEAQKNTYEYNDKGLLAREILYNKTEAGYSESAKSEYSYDANGNLLEIVYYVHATGKAWNVLKKEEYTYEDDVCVRYLAINGTDTKVFERVIENDKTISADKIFIPSTPEQRWPDTHGFTVKRLKEAYFSYDNDVATNTFDYIYTYESTTSIELPQGTKVAVYPNPATDVIEIEANDINHIALYDLQGQMVRDLAVSGDLVQMGVSTLSKGTYLLKVNTAKDSFVQKVVIK